MQQHFEAIRELLGAARRRWRTLAILIASRRAALAASAVVLAAITAGAVAAQAPLALAAIAIAAVLAAIGAAAWGLAPLRHVPSDARVARFVEEHASGLDDRLVSAVDAMASDGHAPAPGLAGPMLADAARHARDVDVAAIIPPERMRRAAFQAAAAVLLLGALVLVSRDRMRQGFDAATLALFPAHVRLEVVPGDVRVKAGTPVTIEARLVGNRAPVTARLQVAAGDDWRDAEMKGTGDGRFAVTLGRAATSFKYRVVAGPATSSTYGVTVVRPPHVTRIDLDYTYPAGLRLKPRTEEDTGDVYAPAGTDVRVRIHTDKPAATGQMALADGQTIPLARDGGVLIGSLKVVDNNSYRVALADPEGLSNPGDTEYFIRTLEDRPPEVRIVKPASDRSVTRLEEVEVEAEADDDYGIAQMDLVYSVRGGKEQVVPFALPRQQTSVTGRRTMYLENMNVQPGDLISYYVRARDLTRGKRSSEAKSDIFFLEVKPFDQEFSLAQSQAMAGAGGGNQSIDDLVTAQKEIVVATWKLDRRSESAKGAKSEQDIRSVSRAEAALKTRVEQTSSTFRESTMRDPRKRQRGQPPSATKALPEEDDMGAAAAAMQKAVGTLEGLNTHDALPPEMEALNHLLKAQSDVKKRQIARQQSGAGRADNNRNYDLSTLFDRELQKNTQTNYETPNSAEQRDDPNKGLLDKVKDLARRQDELMKRQQELAAERGRMSEEELKRQLEKLTRDQLELRQRVEEMAKQMPRNASQSDGRQSENRQAQNRQQGQPSGQQQSGQQQGGQQSSGQQNARSQGQQSGSSGSMQSASEEMRNAAGNLRRQDPAQASAAASRALQRLRDLERELQSSGPDERRRAMGEMQLEARQLADNQRDIASELQKAGKGDADSLRRLAGEQERLAERVRRLQQGLKQASAGDGGASRGADRARKNTQGAAGDAARDLERQRLADRMQQSAEQMRQAANGRQGADGQQTGQQSAGLKGAEQTSPNTAGEGQTGAAGKDAAAQPRPGDSRSAGEQAAQQQDMARALDKLADKLSAATGSRDTESQKLSEQLARAQELRDRLNSLTKQMQEASQKGQQAGGQQAGRQQARGQQGNSSGAPDKAAGQTGELNRGESGGSTGGNDLATLREEYARQLQQTRELLDQLRREDPSFTAQHGTGFTFEGQGMVLSAPGTEAFKQDFAKWEDLRRQATQALDNAQLSLSQKLQAKESRDRLVSGAEDRAPADYQKQVDSYFKAIAAKRKQP